MFKVEIIGNLGAAAEKKNANGNVFVAMNIAHADKYTDKATAEIITNTTWFSVTVNYNIDKIMPYLTSGTKVFVRGNARLKMFTGHDGQQHAGLNISASEIELCGIKQDKKEDL